uniref:Putative ubiquitin/40s ribosomal protein s27a fusion n=1 Tax=Anopheles darlingi TaxID=43151 RepID=A0A2M4CK00_ANODA
MESRFLLDVVVGQSTTILQLLSSEDKTLLIWRDPFLILNLSLHVLNRIGWLDLQSDGLSCQGLHENLHSTTKTEHQMESRFLLDVVVGQSTTILQLLSSEDKTLLIWRDAFLILNLSLHVLNRIGWLDLQSDGLSRQGLHENLHIGSFYSKTTSQMLFFTIT